MGIPDKALVTETGLPVGKLGRQPRVWPPGPSAGARGLSSLCTEVGAVALVTQKGHSPVGTAAAKVEALTRVGATVKIWAWPPADIGSAQVLGTPKGQKVITWGQITT